MAQSATGPVVETVSRRRTISNEEIAAESKRTTPDFWNYLEATTPDQFQDVAGPKGLKLAIIREEPKPSNYGGQNTLEQIKSGFLEVTPGVSVPVNDQEELELGIRKKYGGRAYRLILKQGHERITEAKCVNEAPPKYPDNLPMAIPAGTPIVAGQPDAGFANKALDAVANQNPQMMSIMLDVMTKAADIITKKETAAAAPKPPSEMDDLEKEFRRAMIARMLNPPDPLAELARYKEIFQPANTVKDTLDLLKSIGESPFLKVGRVGGGNNWITDLATSTVPVVADAVKSAVRDWRLGMEAQERGVSIARGVGSNPPPGEITVLPPPQNPVAQNTFQQAPAVQQAPVPAAPASPDPMLPPMEFIEQKIVEMLQRNESVDDTVDLVLDWLNVTNERLVPLLMDPPKLDPRLKPGEQGLLQLFQFEPILRQVPVNPRLVEFIKKFIAKAKADLEEISAPSGAVLLKPVPPASEFPPATPGTR